MNLKTKTNELLIQKKVELDNLDLQLDQLKKDHALERKLSRELFTLGKIKIERKTAATEATRQATSKFIAELRLTLNWAE